MCYTMFNIINIQWSRKNRNFRPHNVNHNMAGTAVAFKNKYKRAYITVKVNRLVILLLLYYGFIPQYPTGQLTNIATTCCYI